MQSLAIITALGTNSVTGADLHQSMDMAVRLLQTPASFWIIILAGVVLSPCMVRNTATSTATNRVLMFGASAALFLAALLLFLLIRHRFISIFADLFQSPECFLIFPFQLGASSMGAILLVLAWYYVHPIAWFRPSVGTQGMAILKSFIPILLTTAVLGVMIVISFFVMLI